MICIFYLEGLVHQANEGQKAGAYIRTWALGCIQVNAAGGNGVEPWRKSTAHPEPWPNRSG